MIPVHLIRIQPIGRHWYSITNLHLLMYVPENVSQSGKQIDQVPPKQGRGYCMPNIIDPKNKFMMKCSEFGFTCSAGLLLQYKYVR